MRDFTETDASWVAEYYGLAWRHYRDLFADIRVFPQAPDLLERFRKAKDSVMSGGWAHWSGVDTAHNELCVAGAILQAANYRIDELVYEPAPANCGQSVDFRARGSDGRLWFVDVKTIAPELIDRWEQFEMAASQNWMSDRTELVLLRDWLGGELWHSKTAARSRMLEYTLELESKLAGYQGWDPSTTVLMLCGNGFHWHEDELEDFVVFYVDGRHRCDDPFCQYQRDTEFFGN